jgi:hypothetical protein
VKGSTKSEEWLREGMRTSSVRHDESALESVVVAYAIPSVAQLVTLECDVGAVKVQKLRLRGRE